MHLIKRCSMEQFRTFTNQSTQPTDQPEAQVRSRLQVRVWHLTSHVRLLSHQTSFDLCALCISSVLSPLNYLMPTLNNSNNVCWKITTFRPYASHCPSLKFCFFFYFSLLTQTEHFYDIYVIKRVSIHCSSMVIKFHWILVGSMCVCAFKNLVHWTRTTNVNFCNEKPSHLTLVSIKILMANWVWNRISIHVERKKEHRYSIQCIQFQQKRCPKTICFQPNFLCMFFFHLVTQQSCWIP